MNETYIAAIAATLLFLLGLFVDVPTATTVTVVIGCLVLLVVGFVRS
jgi:hypothetical protein